MLNINKVISTFARSLAPRTKQPPLPSRRIQTCRVASLALCAVLTASFDCPAQERLLGADVYIGELNQLVQYARSGSTVGLLGDAPVCNAGDAPLDWLTGVGERHPFMNWNMYRYRNGRLVQLGQSWTKHGLGASQDNFCNFGCQPYPNADRLGVGCSDTYLAGFNENTLWSFGPRYEINPWNGAFTFPGSHIAQGNHPHSGLAHRLRVNDASINPATQIGATFYVECYVLAWDDADHLNSIAHEPVIISGAPGGTWTFDLSANATVIGPAIESWPGATVTIVPQTPTNDGRVYFASVITPNANGSYRYEYGIYNHDMDRGIGAFTLPVASTTLTGVVNSYGVPSHGEPYSNAVWTFTQSETTFKWETEDYSVNPFANPIRWGTMFNYYFNATSAPGDVTATLKIFKPGTPANLTVATQGPIVPRRLGDCAPDGGDGVVNVTDLLFVINSWGPCPPPEPHNCLADVAPPAAGDGAVNVTDLLAVINNWG